jgi:hypothetical protein
MRMVWMCIVLLGLSLRPASFAQSSDPTESPNQARGRGHGFQAPGVHVWIGQMRSKAELQALLSEARSKARNRRPSRPDEPAFRNEHVQVYVGGVPKLKASQSTAVTTGKRR